MQHLGWKHRLVANSIRCKTPIGQPVIFPSFQRFISSSSARGPGIRIGPGNGIPIDAIWKPLGIGATLAVLGYVGIFTYATVTFEPRESPLHPEGFTPFTLVSREAISPTSSIFTLKPTRSGPMRSEECSRICSDAWKKGVWNVQVKQPQLQIARSYTPLPPIQAAEKAGNLRFLVRWEPRGEVSTYLHKLILGAIVELRGPHIDYTVPDDVDEVLFIAGGTGVAPALQVAYHLFEKRRFTGSSPRLRILWANRGRGDCSGGISDTPLTSSKNLRHWGNIFYSTRRASKSQDYSALPQSILVQELEALKERNKGNITVDYFCDEEDSYITQDVLKQYLTKPQISKPRIRQNASIGKRLILISGPEGFVNHHAGPKTWAGGQELQGPLGGTLKELDLSEWMIWKL